MQVLLPQKQMHFKIFNVHLNASMQCFYVINVLMQTLLLLQHFLLSAFKTLQSVFKLLVQPATQSFIKKVGNRLLEGVCIRLT